MWEGGEVVRWLDQLGMGGRGEVHIEVRFVCFPIPPWFTDSKHIKMRVDFVLAITYTGAYFRFNLLLLICLMLDKSNDCNRYSPHGELIACMEEHRKTSEIQN